jgi:phenylalanyl-tRNA synthetase alpha chain
MENLTDIHAIQQAFQSALTLEQVEATYDWYCGKQWSLSQANKSLAWLSPEEKKIKGQELQAIRQTIVQLYEDKKIVLQNAYFEQLMKNDIVDYSISMQSSHQWHMHILHAERRRIEDIFTSLWFNIYYGDDVVTKYENFYSVNIPPTHPATEMHDTLFLHQKDETGENLILRTQTSAMQNRLMKQFWVPLRVVIPWKVYRSENLDASHDMVFRQLEWMVIDKWMSIAHFKDLMSKFLAAIFEKETKMHMRPAYFPFVEPWFEIDAWCPICDQKWCSLCKQTWWIELLGAWMMHPAVLQEAGIDPDEYSGFAFGVGINRLVAIKHGIKDIRYFTNGDLKFLQSVGR